MSSNLSDHIDLSWCIMLAEFVEAVIKEILWVFLKTDFGVEMAINVSSVVAKPDIIPGLSKSKC